MNHHESHKKEVFFLSVSTVFRDSTSLVKSNHPRQQHHQGRVLPPNLSGGLCQAPWLEDHPSIGHWEDLNAPGIRWHTKTPPGSVSTNTGPVMKGGQLAVIFQDGW